MRVKNHLPLSRCLFVCLFAFAVIASSAGAQTNEWTWMAGASTSGTFGAYGSPGMPGAASLPGGRQQPVGWTDAQGNLWLFGGEGFDETGSVGYLNDLWKFAPSTGEWTCIGGGATVPFGFGAEGTYGTLGVPAVGNVPPGRLGAVGWKDTNGNLWLFGGSVFNTSGRVDYFSDLWQFNPVTTQWTWMGGPNTPNQSGGYGSVGVAAAGNMPGARESALSWTDSQGNFWLFGGFGYASSNMQGNMNDLWEFKPPTNQWTWVSGSNTVDQPSVYGTLEVFASGNVPAGRLKAVGWMDTKGNLWLFSGGGMPNDLWEFSPSTNQWAWMGGTNTPPSVSGIGVAGAYGVLQTPATGNMPGGRYGAFSWTDRDGNFWMFGGVGDDSTGVQSLLNDLWKFDIATHLWTWMAGSADADLNCALLASWCGPYGIYGDPGTASLVNTPGARYDGVAWGDGPGNLWLMGGIGVDAWNNAGYLDDLWEFQPVATGVQVTAAPTFSPGSGTYPGWQTVSISDSTPGAAISYLVNGTAPALAYTGPITVTSSESIRAIAGASGYANSAVATAEYTANFPQAAAPAFSVPSGTYAEPQTVTISDTTPGATIYFAVGANGPVNFTHYTGPITVSAPETIQAYAVADGFQTGSLAAAAYEIGSGQAPGSWVWMGGSSEIPFSNAVPNPFGQAGWYGTLGTPSAGNIPGARLSASSWTDGAGNFWLFGGVGYDSGAVQGSLNDLWKFDPTSGEWAWMGGADSVPCIGCGVSGIYSTQRVSAAGNMPGGREQAASWTDSKGRFWLMGGQGWDVNGVLGQLNDLWMFDPSTSKWTWVTGSDSVPCRGCGARGLYGLLGKPNSENTPGGRSAAAEWTDGDGNLWLYGGLAYDAEGNRCYLDDLWMFSPTSDEWTWRWGHKFCPYYDTGYPANYSSPGVPSLSSGPGSLTEAAPFRDKNGNLGIFGGFVVDLQGTFFPTNDIWEFQSSRNKWEWVGTNSTGQRGNDLGLYGTLGQWAPGNVPGGRNNAANWTDTNGHLWVFGGSGVNGNPYLGTLNDLWEFDPSSNEWAWMAGSTTFYNAGRYGQPGVAASGNTPGARRSAVTWSDRNGNLWLFGGIGYDSHGTSGFLNDLWEYLPADGPTVPPPASAIAPVISPNGGLFNAAQVISITDQTAGAKIYYTVDGTPPAGNSQVYTGPIALSSPSVTVQAVAVASGYANSTVASAAFLIVLPSAAAPTFSIPGGSYTSAQTVALNDGTTGITIYYTIDGTTPTTSSTIYNGPITVASTETIKAFAVASGYAASPVSSSTYTIAPGFSLTEGASALTISSGSKGSVALTVTPANGFAFSVSFTCSGLPAGATCSFSPPTVTPNGAPITTTLTISTPLRSAAHLSGRPSMTGFVVCIAFGLCGVARRRWRRIVAPCVLFLIGLNFITACGGGAGRSGGGSAPPIPSTVTVTAASGALQESVNLTLTVD